MEAGRRSVRRAALPGAGVSRAVGRDQGARRVHGGAVGERDRAGLRLALGGAAAAVVAGGLVGAPWLSVSAFAEPTSEPSESASATPSSGPSPSGDSSPESGTSSSPQCAESSGVYPRETSGDASSWLPSWVDSSGGHVCVVLDGSALLDSPGQQDDPEPEPSQSLEQSEDTAAILDLLTGWRELFLYSAGLLIFLLGAMFMRSRKA